MTAPPGPAPTAVVVVNYGSSALLDWNLTPFPLSEQVLVVVVDSYHSAAERTAVTALAARNGWTLVGLSDNPGFGTAANAGMDRAARLGADSHVLVNPDARVDCDTVRALAQHCREHDLDLVSPTVVSSTGETFFSGSFLDLDTGELGRRHHTRPRHEPWISGACMAMSERLRQLTSGFDDRFFLYWEDVDLSHRVLAAGGRPVLREDLQAVHDEGGTQGPRRGRAKSNRYYYYNCRNRLLFAALRLDRRDRWRWIRSTPRVSWGILLQGGRRQLLTSPSTALATLAGTVVGVGRVLAPEGLFRRSG